MHGLLTGFEPCILRGGPLDGKKDMVAVIGPKSPCDTKKYLINKKVLTYRIQIDEANEKYLQDENGNWVMNFEEQKNNECSFSWNYVNEEA